MLCAAFQLLKGVIDELLQWPFRESIQLTVKHPSNDKDRKSVARARGDAMYNAKPEESKNPGVYFGNESFHLGDLEREGYVTDDQLHVVWELIP